MCVRQAACQRCAAIRYRDDASCHANLSTMAELLLTLRTKSCIITNIALTNNVDFLEETDCVSVVRWTKNEMLYEFTFDDFISISHN